MSQAIDAPKVKLVPWWLVLIEGILLIIIGIFLLTNPASTFVTIIWVLGIYWLISGIFNIIKIFFDSSMWGWKIFAGIVGIIAGWFLIQNPIGGSVVVSATTVILLGLFGIFIGIVNLIQAFRGAGWGTGILGVISIILGIILLANRFLFTFSLPWALGILAIIGGIIAIFNAFRIRGAKKDLEEAAEAASARAQQMADSADTRSAAATAATVGAVGAVAATAKDDEDDEVTAEDVAEVVEEAAAEAEEDDDGVSKAAVAAAAAVAASEADDEAEEDVVDAEAVAVAMEEAAAEAEEAAGDEPSATAEEFAEAMEEAAEEAEEAADEAAEDRAVGAAAVAAAAVAASEADEDADEVVVVRSFSLELEEPDDELSASIADQYPELTKDQQAGVASLVAAVRSLDPADAVKLHRAAVLMPEQLLERGSSRPGRVELSNESGIDASVILKWVNDLDLKRIKGIGVKYSDLLETAGVDTVVELAQRNPVNLYKKLVVVNDAEHVVEAMPTEEDVKDWVAQAKDLPRIITY